MKDANVKQLNRLRLWDKAGVVLSGLCLVHCLGIPLLLLISPVIGHELIHQDTIFHKWFFVGVITVAAVAFYLGYRVHNNFRPLIWMQWVLFIPRGWAMEVLKPWR